MDWIRNGKVPIKLLLSIISTLFIVSCNTLAYGHNFSSNESAVFLALINEIKAEAQLVQENLSNNSISFAGEHANKASALLTASINDEIAERNQRLADDLNDALATLKASTQSFSDSSTGSDINFVVSDIGGILDEIVTARIDPDQLNNSTIQALTIVELLDEVLSSYGEAYGIGFDMTNMSMMMNDDKINDSMNLIPSGDMNINNSTLIGNTSATEGTELLNITSYQTAQELATKVQELFNSQLMNRSSVEASEVAGQSTDKIAAALQELVNSINKKAPPMEIMTIVHSKIHPNFITEFGLQIS